MLQLLKVVVLCLPGRPLMKCVLICCVSFGLLEQTPVAISAPADAQERLPLKKVSFQDDQPCSKVCACKTKRIIKYATI